MSQLQLVEARMAKCNASSPLRMRMRMPVRENLYEIRWVRVRVGSGVMPVTSQRLRLQLQLVRPSVPGSGSGSAACSRSSRVESSRRSWLAQASWVTVTDLRAFQFPHDSLGLIRVMYAKQAIHDPRSTIDGRTTPRMENALRQEDRRLGRAGDAHGRSTATNPIFTLSSLLSSLLSSPRCTLYAVRCTL